MSQVPRLPVLDFPWAEGIERFSAEAGGELAREMAAMSAAGSGGGGQIEHALLTTYLKDLGLSRYALGFPLDDVKDIFQLAARALLRVFELRGTQPALEVTTIEPNGEPDVLEALPLHPPGATDESLANSRRGREAMLLALAAGDQSLARSLAPWAEDPEGASYLGPDSVVTTPDDQALAKAWRDLLLNRTVPILALSPQAAPGALLEAAALESLAASDGASFCAALGRLVTWHEEQAGLEEHRHQPDWLLCLPGLALATVAMERGVAERGKLPGRSPYLPLELMTGAG